MRLRPVGERGVLVELDDLAAVHALTSGVREAAPDGLVDVVPGYRTVLITVAAAAQLPAVRDLLPRLPLTADAAGGGRLVEVPVVYDGEDLDEVAAILGCDRDEVVRRHTSGLWTVAFCGFAPGFGYLTAHAEEWSVPRRKSPRTRVPPGSVALAGEFSAVYPRETPGGWQLIGRTDLAVFDLDRDPPALLTPETRVRFVESRS